MNVANGNELISKSTVINIIKSLKGNCDSRFYEEALIDAQSEILTLPDENPVKWISNKDNPPIMNKYYLVVTTDGIITGGYRHSSEHWIVFGSYHPNEYVKYWSELPKAPNI